MADLKTIIKISQDELKRQVPVERAVATALTAMGGREAEVLQRRFGLKDGNCQTLAEIGTEFGITRERVRQVESQGLKKFRASLGSGTLHDILAVTTDFVRQHGGVVAQAVLYGRFLPESQQTATGQQALSFLLEQSGSLLTVKPAKRLRGFYAGGSAHQRAVEQLGPVLAKLLHGLGTPTPATELSQRLRADPGSSGAGYLVDEAFTEAVLEISKDFVQTADGNWGLASWPSINPKNIRQKTLYALKLAGTPLHFSEITEQIKRAKLDTKRVTTQAVHNELIHGADFILIGRGIYALAAWGYVAGTVAEVIAAVLTKASQPLERQEVIAEVFKQRHVSRNTIMINLQDKALFERLPDGRYVLAGRSAPADRPTSAAASPATAEADASVATVPPETPAAAAKTPAVAVPAGTIGTAGKERA